jgi:hypothetical protein
LKWLPLHQQCSWCLHNACPTTSNAATQMLQLVADVRMQQWLPPCIDTRLQQQMRTMSINNVYWHPQGCLRNYQAAVRVTCVYVLSVSCVTCAGELFAECPLPDDGTALTTVSRQLNQTNSSSCTCCQHSRCLTWSVPQQRLYCGHVASLALRALASTQNQETHARCGSIHLKVYQHIIVIQ